MRIEKHDKHCELIVDRLESIVDGNVAVCPECGGWMYLDADDSHTDPDDGEIIATCPECGTWHGIDELDDFVCLSDYFADNLGVTFTVDEHIRFRSASIMIAFGGPNIYIDTASGDVELYWWNETGRYPMRRYVVDEIDEWASEYFDMCKWNN